MIYIIISFILAVFIYPVFWWTFYRPVTLFISHLTAGFPTYYDQVVIDMLRVFWDYSPALVVVFSAFGAIVTAVRTYGKRY